MGKSPPDCVKCVADIDKLKAEVGGKTTLAWRNTVVCLCAVHIFILSTYTS